MRGITTVYGVEQYGADVLNEAEAAAYVGFNVFLQIRLVDA